MDWKKIKEKYPELPETVIEIAKDCDVTPEELNEILQALYEKSLG